MAEHCPLKRCATPEDVARVVAFLSSDDGGWVNGESNKLLPSEPQVLTACNRTSHYHLWWIFPVDRDALETNKRAMLRMMESPCRGGQELVLKMLA